MFREFVTIHRGTVGGGGLTTIGDHNLFMAYAHVAHDCRVGSSTIFGNAATLGGHVHAGFCGDQRASGSISSAGSASTHSLAATPWSPATPCRLRRLWETAPGFTG